MILPGPQHSRRLAAFTLLELTVASVMFAIIMAALGGVFFSTMKLRKRTDEMLKDSHQLQQALTIIKNDLRSATIPGGVLSTNMSTSLELTGSGGGQFEFHAASGLLNTATPWIDIQRVSYFLRRPTEASNTNGMDLVRGTTRNLLAAAQEDFNEQILYHDVEQMAFEFWDGTSWLTDWDSTAQIESEFASAPTAIRLSLELTRRPNEDVPRILTVTVPVFTGGITNAAAVTAVN